VKKEQSLAGRSEGKGKMITSKIIPPSQPHPGPLQLKKGRVAERWEGSRGRLDL